MSIRVVVVDDFGVVRDGLTMLLNAEPDIDTVGEAEDAAEGVPMVRELKPDVVVLDLMMHGHRSLDSIPALREAAPESAILVLSTLDDPCHARDAFGAGASGFVLKEAATTKLLEAVREVAAGERYLDPALGARLALTESGVESDGGTVGLSDRERSVLRLLSLGHTCVEIGEILERSPRTIELYRARIMEKLGLTTRADLVRYALAHGLLNGDEDGPGAERLRRDSDART